MRLVCPRCGAQYEIDDSAIPAAGRDVECSACDHVWRAIRPDAEFDAAARPKLNRPLSDSVIDILREEAARELDARAAERKAMREAEFVGTATVIEPLPDEPEPELEPDPVLPDEPPLSENDLPPDWHHEQSSEPVATADGPMLSSELEPQADPVPAAAPVAAPVAKPSARAKSRRRHNFGFSLAVVIAACAVALYALAPRLADQGALGAQLMEWRSAADEGRDWLQLRGDALIERIKTAVQ